MSDRATEFLDWVDRGHKENPLAPDLPPNWTSHLHALARHAQKLAEQLKAIRPNRHKLLDDYQKTVDQLPETGGPDAQTK